jgi:ribosomal protein L11 methyltransferase
MPRTAITARAASARRTLATSPPHAGATWLEAAVRVPLDAAERVGTLLVEAGSQGVVTSVHELARGARTRRYETVRGFFPAGDPVRARLAVRAALSRAADPALGRARVTWRELDERLWEMDWREHFQPVVAGRSLVVVPPWNRERFGARRRIVVHPGMAFGTGQHATTLSCLEALERLASPPPRRALDVGTGTGILALALAKLGVRDVLAIDTDPQAVTAARANVRRNGLAARITVSSTPLAAPPLATTQFPLVVANLYVDALVALEPTLAAVVTPGGTLVTSGLLRAQQRRLRTAFAAPRWRLRSATRRGAWVTSVFTRER